MAVAFDTRRPQRDRSRDGAVAVIGLGLAGGLIALLSQGKPRAAVAAPGGIPTGAVGPGGLAVPPGATLILGSGTVLPPGTVILPPGAGVPPGANPSVAPGSETLPPGTIIRPGSQVLPPGALIPPDLPPGSVIIPPASTILPPGTTFPPGTELPPGTVIAPGPPPPGVIAPPGGVPVLPPGATACPASCFCASCGGATAPAASVGPTGTVTGTQPAASCQGTPPNLGPFACGQPAQFLVQPYPCADPRHYELRDDPSWSGLGEWYYVTNPNEFLNEIAFRIQEDTAAGGCQVPCSPAQLQAISPDLSANPFPAAGSRVYVGSKRDGLCR